MLFLRFLLSFWLLSAICLSATAQLSVQFPVSRFITQRGLDNQGRIYIATRLTESVDRVEAQ
ncbi:MAG TPA: hypothetical protein VGA96_02685, partial [Fibrella sp.]